ncbi:hypothetical protein PHPALM_28137 [Phytophthora palmivora]|uniref:Uncharacterized protein n=1 Tax=Phytophthora palmivora TaxID=4796 RepID=A0A2P4XAW9_9STRA|nr:hypothetical protein PHPALM_28137 [Phytophthora palmivora]
MDLGTYSSGSGYFNTPLSEINRSFSAPPLVPASPRVPRSGWFPGLNTPRLFRAADVFPWGVDRVSHLHVSDLIYLEYEEKHLQAFWESSHFLPISDDMCSADATLTAYHGNSRQRRSRAGAAWKQFLQRHLIPVLRQQRCDLDVLLDPFFLHFPKSRHPKSGTLM